MFSVSNPGSNTGLLIIAPFLYNDERCLINATLFDGNLHPSLNVMSYTPLD